MVGRERGSPTFLLRGAHVARLQPSRPLLAGCLTKYGSGGLGR
jgi:hypothetical protein